MTTVETLNEFESHRRALFGIAYRMLGSASEAEDIVQEAWLRWQAARGEEEVRSPRAYLTTVVTRLCLDHLKSARVQREQYLGTWLPEPVLTLQRVEPSPDDRLERLESLSLAFLVVLERLAPVERAVFLLHDVFDYGYGEIAQIVGRSEAACRQVLSRARKHIQEGRPRVPAAREDHQRIANLFLRALNGEEVDEFVDVLAEDVVLYSDGGGKAPAAPNPIYGRDRLLRAWEGFSAKMHVTRMDVREVNGDVAILLWDHDELHTVLSIETAGGLVTEVFAQRNPDKLAALLRDLAAEAANVR